MVRNDGHIKDTLIDNAHPRAVPKTVNIESAAEVYDSNNRHFTGHC